MTKKILVALVLGTVAVLGFGCNQTAGTSNANANPQNVAATRIGPDDSEITTTIDENGVKTETRTFRNNARVSKVVITTRDGKRTVKAYSRTNEEKEVNDVGDALAATGNAIADAAGWVGDKAGDMAQETKGGLKTAGEKTVDVAKTVGEKTATGAKTVGGKTAEGATAVGEKTAEVAKKVGKKTAEGAKKTGKAIKNAVTP